MDTAHIDQAVADLQESKDRWVTLPIVDKIAYLDAIKDKTVSVAEPWVEAATKAKGLSMDQPAAGEEWLAGPFTVLWYLKDLRTSLVRLASGIPILHGYESTTSPSGQVVVDVFPKSFDERVLFSGVTAEVWMDPQVTEENLEDTTAEFYRTRDPRSRVTVTLGAGNVASIPFLDVLYALFVEGNVVVLKMNPVNDYLGPFFETIFDGLIADGFVRITYGGAEVGAYLSTHDGVDSIHITGSATTYNAIVFGTGAEGDANREGDRPKNSRPVSAELGGAAPFIVVPGAWSNKDIRYQAEHLVSQKLNNSGFNCIAAQVLVLPRTWDQKDQFLDAVRSAMAEAEDRDPYYPGSSDRAARAVNQSDEVERFGDDHPRYLVTGLDAADSQEPWFTKEIFGPALAVTELPGADPASFLANAVEFANEYLYGTLGANIVVDPKTARANADALDQAVADLRYGTVAVNAWTGVGYFLGRCPWGAFPGHARDDIQSGTGVVHNALMFTKAEKSVIRGPFAEAPRSFLKGEFHLAPKLVYLITNKQAHVIGEKLIDYCDEPSKAKIASIAASALRG
ncbi:MAG: aldehyde dehydrogenase family protein [Armatimonadetes bacterium]|nr:MAG: aldehyde dehydrogenase family protein [Armatimonadota bacterium]